jgi:hypothetical protein
VSRIRLFVTCAMLLLPRNGLTQAISCPAPDSLAPWVQVLRTWKTEVPGQWTNDSLRRVLLAMADADQAARREFGARAGDSVFAKQLMADDSVRAKAMSAILDRFGLPGRSLVGAAGSDAAMLLVQHNGPLQARALTLANRLPAGQVSPEALAMLEDRLAVSEGRPQRYGTQFSLGPDTIFRLAPMAPVPDLAARRARAGLPPMSLYVCWLKESGMRVDAQADTFSSVGSARGSARPGSSYSRAPSGTRHRR